MQRSIIQGLKRASRAGAILVGALALFAAGCAHQGQPTSPAADTQPAKSTVTMQSAGEAAEDYAIGAGDVLEISVWNNANLSRQVVVLPDGTISFPLVGQFTAAGKTVVQLKADMEARISRYVAEPDLSVIIQQVNSLVVYVIGKVNRPGHIPLNRNITVLQALSMAGGLNIFADQQDISIVRKLASGTQIIPFNYKAVTENNRMEENIQLQRGDVIVVR